MWIFLFCLCWLVLVGMMFIMVVCIVISLEFMFFVWEFVLEMGLDVDFFIFDVFFVRMVCFFSWFSIVGCWGIISFWSFWWSLFFVKFVIVDLFMVELVVNFCILYMYIYKFFFGCCIFRMFLFMGDGLNWLKKVCLKMFNGVFFIGLRMWIIVRKL